MGVGVGIDADFLLLYCSNIMVVSNSMRRFGHKPITIVRSVHMFSVSLFS